MDTCRDCLHQELCDTYSRMGVTDVPADDITICELFKPKSDYVKRERGEWVFVCTYKHTNYYRCSRCTRVYPIFNNTRFCQHCAADMRKENNNA